MDIYAEDFESLARQEWDYPSIDKDAGGTQLTIYAADSDTAGGKTDMDAIDRIAEHPEARSVSVFGLRQSSFEYFIKTYGRQFRYIRFFRNKFVEDWSLIGTLPDLEGL